MPPVVMTPVVGIPGQEAKYSRQSSFRVNNAPQMSAALVTAPGKGKMAAEVPLVPFGGDKDLNGPVVLLASEAGRHITGQTLAVGGGVAAT